MEAKASPAPTAKKRTGLIAGILIAIVLCLCLLAISIAGVVVLIRSNALTLTKWVPYTSQQTGLSLSYPDGWVYEEDAGSIAFGSSQSVLDDGPTTPDGAGLLVLHLPAGQYMTASPTDFLDDFITSGEWGNFQPLGPVSESQISGHPAASVEATSLDESANVTYHVQVTAIRTPEALFVLIGISLEDSWSQHAGVIRHMIDSVEISSP